MSSKSTKPSKKELSVKANSEEEKIIRESRAKIDIIRESRAKIDKLQYHGSPIAIYEDYAPEVIEQRAKYREVLVDLYNLSLKPVLIPGRAYHHWMTKDGGKKRLASVETKSYLMNIRANGM
ncbi:hypothetical protein AOLI_G00295060 [Acnodon oligacanthus]